MTNLPVTKDHFSGRHAGGDVLWLDEKQLKQFEASAKLKLTNPLIAELSFAIDNYINATGKNARTLSRSKTRRKFRAFQKNLDLLSLLLSDSTSPENKEVRQKIESALWFIYPADREELKKTPGLTREDYKKLNDASDTKKPFVDTGRFQIDLVYLRRATNNAIDRFEQEGKDQKSTRVTGSKKEVAFDRLLEDLEGIYKKASGVRGSFVDFLLAVYEVMPEKNRPRLPKGWESTQSPKGRARKTGGKT